jgi:ribosome recycling factor
LLAELKKHADQAKAQFPDLRSARSINLDPLAKLPVKNKQTGQVTRLDELAVVVPTKGRGVEIRMHSASSRRDIMSAVQASEAFNQQPQPDPDNELVLNMRLEAESTADRLRLVHDACHRWRTGVRDAVRERNAGLSRLADRGSITRADYARVKKAVMKEHDAALKKADEDEKRINKAIESARTEL